jgi:radical SAM protein with 4Fe4S-binding SPASM domain
MGEELTYQEVCHIIDQIVDAGCLWLCITGGEPLIRSDFMDIYSYAKQKGMFITLFTNGALLTPKIADFLAELRPFKIEITLYGMSEETYEEITGVRGSFERTLRGVELLLERGLPLNLKSMIFTTNKHELQEMKKYAEKIGVSYKFDTMINAKLDGSLEPTKLRLSPAEIVELDLADPERVKGMHDFFDRYGTVRPRNNLYICGAGTYNFHISSAGELGMCTTSREPHYNLRQGTFRDGFYNAIPAVRRQKRTRYSECQTCELIGVCEQCPAWGQLEHGDPEARVDFVCQVAHLRADAFGQHKRAKAKLI